MKEVELGYLLHYDAVHNLATALFGLWEIQLSDRCYLYDRLTNVYFDSQGVPVSG